jgi:hypothetical protein
MGKITIIIPDDLESRIRKRLVAEYDGKIHGKLTELVISALENYLKQETSKKQDFSTHTRA